MKSRKDYLQPLGTISEWTDVVIPSMDNEKFTVISHQVVLKDADDNIVILDEMIPVYSNSNYEKSRSENN